GLLPDGFALFQNYPNPFNPGTSISYRLSAISQVTLKVYDVLGREVATLVNEVKGPGEHSARFVADGLASGLASGTYFYRLTAGAHSITKKFVLQK
ncbi:T9SS type A sorting domain-containing protein, partial [Sphingobacteriales bacterium CHB3]|nr:T9SS type A sorting domain-containing protein [Sphingobacteriales bacterium CHB3]